MSLNISYQTLIRERFADSRFSPSQLHAIGFEQGIQPSLGVTDCTKACSALRRAGFLKLVRASRRTSVQSHDGIPRNTVSEPVYRMVTQ
jgi:hypothetical protein